MSLGKWNSDDERDGLNPRERWLIRKRGGPRMWRQGRGGAVIDRLIYQEHVAPGKPEQPMSSKEQREANSLVNERLSSLERAAQEQFGGHQTATQDLARRVGQLALNGRHDYMLNERVTNIEKRLDAIQEVLATLGEELHIKELEKMAQ
jgi:hypothetical protein